MNKELIEALEKAVVELRKSDAPSDPHAENKALYAQDALVHKAPWELWECLNPRNGNKEFLNLYGHPSWHEHVQYRRKQTKKRVDWSCKLLKGANNNCGELYQLLGRCGWLTQSRGDIRIEALRLANTDAAPSNWQAYNGEDLNLLHEAGFVLELKLRGERTSGFYVVASNEHALENINTTDLAAYRVIAIREGFTDNPKEGV